MFVEDEHHNYVSVSIRMSTDELYGSRDWHWWISGNMYSGIIRVMHILGYKTEFIYINVNINSYIRT